MAADEKLRAAYCDLTQAAAMLDRHGGQLSGELELTGPFRAARANVDALVTLLCGKIDAFQPDQRQAEWARRHPWDRLP